MKDIREASEAFERHERGTLRADPRDLAEGLAKLAALEPAEACRRVARNKRIAAKIDSRADRQDFREEQRRESGRKLHALKNGRGRR